MISIRLAQESDVELIADVALLCFPDDFKQNNSTDTKKAAIKWVEERFSLSTFAKYHVAVDDGKIVGYIFHLMIGGLSGVVQLEQIGVDLLHRGKGVGTSLIIESEKTWKKYLSEKFTKPLYKMLLTTSKINDTAHNLYAKCGFKYETLLTKMYWGEDEEIWIKEF